MIKSSITNSKTHLEGGDFETDNIEDYIERHISPEPPELKEIDRLTNLRYVNGRMCSGHIQGRLLKMLAAMIRPKRVLELGTFTGYSALCIAEGIEEGATIDTIEVDDEMEDVILENLKKSEYGSRITLHIGDALEVVRKWNKEEFDMVFIDADKRSYRAYFEAVLPLVRKGGFILVDNTLWDGHVVETGKHSSQTAGILEFNALVARHPEVETAIVPLRDGLTLLRKL